tara:strand:- start:425 stop:898 length:474 start_codon:yes stop_codon:yes gene_type:complete
MAFSPDRIDFRTKAQSGTPVEDALNFCHSSCENRHSSYQGRRPHNRWIPDMIYDHRTYTLVTRKLKPYLKLFEEFALPVMQENGMVLERYFVTQIGSLNEVVHIWRYESLAALEQIRIRRDADPRWADYLKRSEGMVLMQQNKIVEEASFSPGITGR